MGTVLFAHVGLCVGLMVDELLCLPPSGSGGWKSSKHQLSDRLQVRSIHPQRELLLPDSTGPQQSLLPGKRSSRVVSADTPHPHQCLTQVITAPPPAPAGGDALQRLLRPREERHHLGKPLLHPVPRRPPRQGRPPRLRGGRLRRHQGRRVAPWGIHLSECSVLFCWASV